MHYAAEGQRPSSNLVSQNQNLLMKNGMREAKAGNESISVQEMRRAGFIHQPEYRRLKILLLNSSQGIALFCRQQQGWR